MICLMQDSQIQNRLAKPAQHRLQRTAALPLLCGARLASKCASIQTNLPCPAAAAKPNRWVAPFGGKVILWLTSQSFLKQKICAVILAPFAKL